MKGFSVFKLAALCACLVFLGTITIYLSPALAKDTHLRLATSKEGTNGYACGVGLAAAVKKNLKGIGMEALPTPGSTASVKILAKGEADIAYCSNWTLNDAYKDTGPFAKKSIKNRPLQGIYFFGAQFFPVVMADSDIKCYADLAGKKVFPYSAGAGVYDNFKAVYIKLGLWKKMQLRQVGLMEAADALKMGTVVCLPGYHYNDGLSTAPWMRDVDARVLIRAVNPTPEEEKLIRQVPNFNFGYSSSNWMRPKNAAMNKHVFHFEVLYGFHPAPNVPTDVWYKIFKTWVEKAKEDLAPINATLKFFATKPLEIIAGGMDAGKGLPIHPGSAKYLKEKGIWKDGWKIGKLAPGVN